MCECLFMSPAALHHNLHWGCGCFGYQLIFQSYQFSQLWVLLKPVSQTCDINIPRISNHHERDSRSPSLNTIVQVVLQSYQHLRFSTHVAYVVSKSRHSLARKAGVRLGPFLCIITYDRDKGIPEKYQPLLRNDLPTNDQLR